MYSYKDATQALCPKMGVPPPRLWSPSLPQREGGAGACRWGSPSGQLAPCSSHSPGQSAARGSRLSHPGSRRGGGNWRTRSSWPSSRSRPSRPSPAGLQPRGAAGVAGQVPAPRCCARPLPLPTRSARPAAPLALPPPPRRGPSLYYGNGDIQRERLARTAAPGSRAAGGSVGGAGCGGRAAGALARAPAPRPSGPPAPDRRGASPEPRPRWLRGLRASPGRPGSRAGRGRIRRFGREPAAALVYGKVSRRAPGLHVAEQGRLSHVRVQKSLPSRPEIKHEAKGKDTPRNKVFWNFHLLCFYNSKPEMGEEILEMKWNKRDSGNPVTEAENFSWLTSNSESKTSIFSTLASEKSFSDCKKVSWPPRFLTCCQSTKRLQS
ncbi:translation initiation factor IF-2-like [Acinonyx jubatus]|uniref:Translation initiation factor IF-2-like n=1 Tax=Acinonyx jubatus TaxID=32536 RepID=A0ABM3PKE4_ACIJB|nr:translation initiation factor IF-2-like [Acinonyx jubatus]